MTIFYLIALEWLCFHLNFCYLFSIYELPPYLVWLFMSYTESEIIYQVIGEYGYSIEHILLVDIIPDAAVRKAMNEINAGNDMY